MRRDIPAKLEMDQEENDMQKKFFETNIKNRICYEVNSTQCFDKFKKLWENEPKL